MSTPIPIHGLHALAYCERLFYLENVEHLRVADERVFAGRRLHAEIERKEEDGEVLAMTLESQRWGLIGKVDCIRRRDGALIPYEHKRGRAARTPSGDGEAWWSDKLQVFAYAALIEEHSGQAIGEGRIRYHADNVMVRVAINDDARRLLTEAIARARELQASVERPPVTVNERLCARCSLAPVCLPEEARLARQVTASAAVTLPQSNALVGRSSANLPSEQPGIPRKEIAARKRKSATRLFPSDDDRQVLHVVSSGARVGRRGDRIEVAPRRDEDAQPELYPVNEIGQIVLHGFAQITTQALGFCAHHEVGVHWLTAGGRYLGAWSSGSGAVQRRIRQYRALTDEQICLRLAKQLVEARVRSQLSFLLRSNRDRGSIDPVARPSNAIDESIVAIRKLLGPLSRSENIHSLRGYEGSVGAQYFKALPALISDECGEEMKPKGRNRRPPRDRTNALLSFGYSLLMRDVLNAILVVGLDPSLGFYHQPRSQAHPLALDLMELFRVPLVDLPVLASINRRQWNTTDDFSVAGPQVWLSDSGRKKMIAIYERRKEDHWKHPVIGYSLSYARLMELEVRLLEKEWMNEGGLFARMRLR